MSKRYQLSLYIFRRDLRLHDNTALLEALRDSEQVIVSFIFDSKQTSGNDYFGARAFCFMLQSLEELARDIKEAGGKLYFFSGSPDKITQQLLNELPIDAVYINSDYTPFSIQRDESIQKVVESHQRDFHQFDDALLHEPGAVLKANDEPYVVYTPFMRRARQLQVPMPQKNNFRDNYYTKPIKSADPEHLAKFLKKYHEELIIPGGRQAGKKLIKKIDTMQDYDEMRNLPAADATTHLSPHHKFGTVSVREVYHYIRQKLSASHTLINELFWRDFFTHIGYFYPHVFNGAFHEKYNKLKWSRSQKNFERWCEGKTGFLLVDAGMRELNETGYMHNRVRMVTASFLVKDLHIDWRWGERYFAQQLIDYDPAVNNGNWQWAASTGCDAQPYFRIFNPQLQQKRFDPQQEYIKRWIPELGDDEPYIEPIVDHKVASAEAKAMYAEIS